MEHLACLPIENANGVAELIMICLAACVVILLLQYLGDPPDQGRRRRVRVKKRDEP